MRISIPRDSLSVKKMHMAILLIVCLCVYGAALRGEFLWDDETLIVTNPGIRAFSPLATFVRPFSSAFPTYYRPLQIISYQLDFLVWGMQPSGFHLTNVLLHALNCLLLYWLLCRISRNRLTAFLAAFLWGIHPLLTEPVNYISSRSDLLAAFFLLLSAFFLSGQGRAQAVLSAAAFSAALLSKESALVFVLFLIVASLSGGTSCFKRILPHCALAAVYAAVRLSFSGAFPDPLRVPWQRLMLTDTVVIATYVKLFFVPVGLHKNWIVWLADSVRDGRVVGALILLSCIAGAAVSLSRRRTDRIFLFGLGWFFIMLIPSLSSVILPLAGRTGALNTVVSEAWGYCASCGLAAACARLIRRAYRVHRAAIPWMLAVLACTLSFLTVRRTLVWAGDPARFFEETLRYHPHNAQLHYNLANAYAARGAWELAELEYCTVMALAPGHARCLNNLCAMYIRREKFDKAVDACSRALAIDPGLRMAQENLIRARVALSARKQE